MKRAYSAFLTTTMAALGLACAQAEPVLRAAFRRHRQPDQARRRQDTESHLEAQANPGVSQRSARQTGQADGRRQRQARGDSAQAAARLGQGRVVLRRLADRRPPERHAHHGAGQKSQRALGSGAFRQLATRRGGEPLEQTVAGFTGWRVDFDNGRTLGFGYADGWLLLGSGQETLNYLKKAAGANRRYWPPLPS